MEFLFDGSRQGFPARALPLIFPPSNLVSFPSHSPPIVSPLNPGQKGRVSDNPFYVNFDPYPYQ